MHYVFIFIGILMVFAGAKAGVTSADDADAGVGLLMALGGIAVICKSISILRAKAYCVRTWGSEANRDALIAKTSAELRELYDQHNVPKHERQC